VGYNVLFQIEVYWVMTLFKCCGRIPKFQKQHGPMKRWYPTITLHGVS